MKVGIITITEGANFGNKLQNYALQTYLESNFNCNVETFKNKSTTIKWYIISKFLKKKDTSLRKKIFDDFTAKNIKMSNLEINNWITGKKFKDYDVFICGSDQIWNSSFKENDSANFGYFIKNKPVISYAASFGIDHIENNKEGKYARYLSNLKKISVREDAGKKIVEELTGRNDVEVLIDPTLLLNDDQWSKIAKKPQNLTSKKYILNYFLGNISDSRKKEIERIAKENNCEIIDILDKKSEFYNIGPEEFLYLEKNAFLICTDSFHSCVFAFIFNRPFIVFERQDKLSSMNSRIETLINKFKLNGRKCENNIISTKNLEHDYSNSYKILEKEKINTYNYLNIYLKKE